MKNVVQEIELNNSIYIFKNVVRKKLTYYLFARHMTKTLKKIIVTHHP